MDDERKNRTQLIDEMQALRLRVAELEAQESSIASGPRYMEHLFARAFRLNPAATAITRLRDAVLLDVNDKFVELTQYSPEEAIGRTSEELGLWADRDARDRLTKIMMAEGAVREVDMLFRAKDGSTFEGRTSLALIDLDGELCVQAIVQDVTERKRVEQAWRDGEARYRSLVTASAQIVWTTTPDGQVVDNPLWRAITGQTVEEAAGWGWLEVVHPDDRASALSVWNAAVAASSPYETEYRVRNRDGDYRVFAVRGVPVLDENHQIREWVGTCTDITERKWNEQVQRFQIEASTVLSSSLDYDTIVQNFVQLAVPRLADWCVVDIQTHDTVTRVAIAHTDPDKVALAWELELRFPIAARKLFGPTRVIESGEPLIQPVITDAMLERSIPDPEYLRILRTLGITSTMIVPLITRGHTLGAITFVIAASGRRYQPKDLDLAQDLAGRAALALDNALLYHEAQEALRSRDEFLAVAAHELRTPTSLVVAHAELLQRRIDRDGQASERDRRAVKTLSEQARRLTRILQTVFDISQLQTGELLLDLNPLDITLLVNRIIQEAAEADDKHIYDLSVPSEPIHIVGDEMRLEQVLQNIVRNAQKYSAAQTTVRVQVEVNPTEVAIHVADEGIGIPPTAMPDLFRRFYRGGNVGPNTPGLGVGLYIVKEIVTLHNGRVDVFSTPGQGTTFTVTLPRNT